MIFRQYDPFEKKELGKFRFWKLELAFFGFFLPTQIGKLSREIKNLKIGDRYLMPNGSIIKRTK